MKLNTSIHYVSEKVLKVTGSKVKVICVQLCEWYDGGGIVSK